MQGFQRKLTTFKLTSTKLQFWVLLKWAIAQFVPWLQGNCSAPTDAFLACVDILDKNKNKVIGFEKC